MAKLRLLAWFHSHGVHHQSLHDARHSAANHLLQTRRYSDAGSSYAQTADITIEHTATNGDFRQLQEKN